MLAGLLILGMMLIVAILFLTNRIYVKFINMLRVRASFLTDYKETPRSRLIKKYIPPMQPLVEDRDLESQRSSINSQFVFENNLSTKLKVTDGKSR